MFKNKNTILLIIVFVIIGLIGTGIILFINAPRLNYKVEITDEDNIQEIPLSFNKNQDDISFELGFYDLENKYDKSHLNQQLMFTNKFPFVSYSDTLLVTLVTSKKMLEEDNYVYYKIDGEISNLQHNEYKFRVEDEYGNLIDEKVIKLSNGI